MSFFDRFRREDKALATESSAPARAKDAVLSLDEFRSFMEFVNGECRGIGCGYARRDCRSDAMANWLAEWARGNRERTLLLRKLRREFTENLPDYFRNYSRHDRVIENEGAFVALHGRIVAALDS